MLSPFLLFLPSLLCQSPCFPSPGLIFQLFLWFSPAKKGDWRHQPQLTPWVLLPRAGAFCCQSTSQTVLLWELREAGKPESDILYWQGRWESCLICRLNDFWYPAYDAPESQGRLATYGSSLYVLKHLLFQCQALSDASVWGHSVPQHWSGIVGSLCPACAKRGWKAPSTGVTSCSVTSTGTFTGAGPLACKSKLLSHTIVFWAFCKALYYFGWEITMEGYVQGPLGMSGPCRMGLCFVLCGSRGSPHSRSPEEWAACFDISFQFTAAGEQQFRKGLDYNIGERLHLVPFCVLAQSCAAIANFERVFASTCTHRLSVYLMIPSKLLIPKLLLKPVDFCRNRVHELQSLFIYSVIFIADRTLEVFFWRIPSKCSG